MSLPSILLKYTVYPDIQFQIKCGHPMTLSVECSFSKVLQTSIAMIHFFGYDFLVPYK